jgi:hypothetical protein
MLGTREIARRRRTDGQLELRPQAVRCRLPLRGLSAADDHVIDVTFSCAMQALDERAEREMLAETFLSRSEVVTIEDVVGHFSDPLRDALARLIATQPGDHWLLESSQAAVIEALRGAAKPVAFNCGIELLAPFEVSIESPTLQRQRIEEMQRKLAERRAAGQVEQVQRAAELLKQFQSLRDAAPAGSSPGALLDRMNPSDRGSMLETLLMAQAAEATAMLWAVAGPNLIRIDPRQSPSPQVIPLPTDLGPLRSVQAGEMDGRRGLLVGAQIGVMFVEPASPESATRFRDVSEISTSLGFNSVAANDAMVWASHGDAGVVGWTIGENEKPCVALRAARGARNLATLPDRRIVYSIEGNAFVATAEGSASVIENGGAGAPIVIISVDSGVITLARGDGSVERIDATSLQPIGTIERRAGEVTAAGTLPWLGTTRLLLATADGPIVCVGADDTLVTQYVSAHRGLRAVAACADTVAALSGDRQRIILWKTWNGRQIAGEVHIGSLARHRAADVCFA